MSDFNDRYNRASAMRLNSMPGMVPGAMAPPQQPYGPAPASYGKSWADLLEALGMGGKPQQPSMPQQSVTVPATPPQSPSPFNIPYTGPRNTMQSGLPPFMAPGDAASTYMPPRGLPSLSPPRQDNYGPGPSPAPSNAAPAAPRGADAAFVPPPGWSANMARTAGDADLGGYGGNPGMGRPFGGIPQVGPYDHLNPTPSLASSFAQQYSANPQGFDNSFLKRLFG